MKKERENCVLDWRVSDDEQLKGGGLEDQEMAGRLLAERRDWNIVNVFKRPHSATTINRGDIVEIKKFIRNSSVPIHHYIIRCIDRFTRVGYPGYVELKGELEKLGVQLWDTYGIIQPKRNTLEHVGDFKYWWSEYSPSEAAEMLAAYHGNVEVRSILTRMIGAEIRLVGDGYAVRTAPAGLRNKRIVVDVDGVTKRRCVREADPKRAHYFKKMFELRAKGVSDKEIVETLNAEGFRTPTYKRWDRSDPLKPKVIGTRGGKPLTVKRLQRYIKTTQYAGVVCEKWTHYLPIRMKGFDGIVSIETFNAANRGQRYIKEEADGSLLLLTDYSPFGRVRRRRDNPDYPFKLLPCHLCGRPMLGSAPRGRSGQRFPTYHCGGSQARNHKYYGIPKEEFDENVERYIASLEYTNPFFAAFEKAVLSSYRNRAKDVIARSAAVSKNVSDLKARVASKLKTLDRLESPTVSRMIEQEIEALEAEIQAAEGKRDKAEIEEKHIKLFLRRVQSRMEHPIEFLIERDNMDVQKALFELVFDEMPSYADILNGTPKLSHAFRLSEDFKVSDSNLVRPMSLEWNTLEDMIVRWNRVIDQIEDVD